VLIWTYSALVLAVSTFVWFRGTDGDGPLILLVDKTCIKTSQFVIFGLLDLDTAELNKH
jgi:hypothetical protein